MSKENLYNLSLDQLKNWVAAQGLKPYAATQLVQWLYEKGAVDFDDMTNVSKQARALLSESFALTPLEEVQRFLSTDGSVKFGFKLADGEIIESVLMPISGRVTLCVSSQVGCAMGCRFCKTAEMKLRRNLSQGEILGQVMAARSFLASNDEAAVQLKEAAQYQRLSNIVFMGMGEPLHNFEAVVGAVDLLLDDRAFNFSRKKITVSTSGLAPQIKEFGARVPAKLAVSLNATNDTVRTEIMPINRRHDLKELMAACRTYAEYGHGVVTFEYVLLGGVNDSLVDAKELVSLIANTPCKLNLIPFNEYPESTYRRPEPESIRQFHKYLAERGFQVNIRYSKGLDVLAACGQLATEAKAQQANINPS